MKGYKKLVPIALVACLLLSFYMLYDTRTSNIKEYNQYLNEARNYAEQGIAVDALENYAKALGVKNTLELNIEVGNFYVELDEIVSAIGWGEQMIEAYPNSPEAYEFLLARYREVNDFNRCYALYDTISKRNISSKEISKIMKDIKYVYYFGEAFDNVDVYSEGYCAVEYEGKWGLVDEEGNRTAGFLFKTIGPYIDGLAPVTTEEGDAYFIDQSGNKKMVVKTKDKITELKSAVGEVFAAKIDDKWTFFNKKNEKLSGSYNNVSLLANTVAAVEHAGSWSIVGEDFKAVSKDKYADVVADDRGIIYRNEVIFVNKGGSYIMVDNTGKQISDKTFEDAATFLDTTYAAVKGDKGWYFIDSKGKAVFKDTYYEEAKSFSNGFAAVKKDGNWGFIDIDGNVAIDFQFEDVKNFNTKGCVFVKNENIWQLLRLYMHNYES